MSDCSDDYVASPLKVRIYSQEDILKEVFFKTCKNSGTSISMASSDPNNAAQTFSISNMIKELRLKKKLFENNSPNACSSDTMPVAVPIQFRNEDGAIDCLSPNQIKELSRKQKINLLKKYSKELKCPERLIKPEETFAYIQEDVSIESPEIIKQSFTGTYSKRNLDEKEKMKNKKYLEKMLELKENKYESDFIDTHCHLDFLYRNLEFQGSFEQFMEESVDLESFPKSFGGCIAIFCKPNFFTKVRKCEKILESPKVWGAFGCHPHFSDCFGEYEESILRYQLLNAKTVALGEIGLDFSRINQVECATQEKVFRKQLQIGCELKKPLVIHSRDSHILCFKIMKELVSRDHIIHRHCFTGDWEEANDWLQDFDNLYLGFTGLITYNNERARRIHEVVRKIPLNRVLLETDAPYFRPKQLMVAIENEEKSNPNHSNPGFALYVAVKIAELKGISLEEVIAQTRKNTRDVYSI